MANIGPVKQMMSQFPCRTHEETREALRQVTQELTLLALSRTKFFDLAAFYGGTALRIFHELPRFSEDLDFSLMLPDRNFNLTDFLPKIEEELASFGLEMHVTRKEKRELSPVQSAFIKGNTLVHLVKVTSVGLPVRGIPSNEVIKIKLEIDVDPPKGAGYELKFRLLPVPFSVRLYDKPSLFAGKVHALLCRGWKNRVKGRDFYDYLWYLANNVPVNMVHLKERMVQSGHWNTKKTLTIDDILQILENRIDPRIIELAKVDVSPFIANTQELDLWSKDFFLAVSEDRLRSST
ncbi:MAG: nucleotidyl transferase AbiEii/AbiGii toxin family protein [Spirochaetales bacterium]|nr:nucleotidyl transferase AbiEii/AbiGii toxin family protein [Spirochaetales bacterium]